MTILTETSRITETITERQEPQSLILSNDKVRAVPRVRAGLRAGVGNGLI